MVREALQRRFRRSGPAWAGLAGLLFAIFGFLASFALLQNAAMRVFASISGVKPRILPYLVALSTFLVGGICWWAVVERPRRLTRGRGALVGLLTGLLVHPVLWFLAYTYLGLESGAYPWNRTSLLWVLLVTFFSLGFAGVVTIAVGIVGGLLVALARERTVEWEDGDEENGDGGEEGEEESLRRTFATFLLNGIVTLVVLLVTSFLLPALLAAVLVAVAVSVAVLPRLPVVRTFLVHGYYRSSEKSVSTLTEWSFLLRHAVGVGGIAGLYYLLFFGYGALVDYLYYSVLSDSYPVLSRELSSQLFDYSFLLYPFLFVAGSLLVALALNRRWNGWEPSGSRRRAALEWTAFLVLVVTTYTVTMLLWFGFGLQSM